MKQSNDLETLNYSGIFLTCFSTMDTKCIDTIPVHSLNFVCSGEQILEDGNRRIVVEAGEAVFVRRNHRTKIYKNGKDGEPYKGISLTFQRSALRNVYTKLSKSSIAENTPIVEENVFKIGQRADVKSLFLSLVPYFDDRLKPTEAVTDLKVLEGIYALLNTSDVFYKILFDFADPWKMDILEFLSTNYMDDLSIEQIATYTGRSLATLKRDFKKISTLSPQRWVMKKRLDTAYSLLKEGKTRVHDVYLDVGFKNPSHFSTAFKRQFGISPTEIQP